MSQKKHLHGCCADKCCNDVTCMELPEGKHCGDCVFFNHCAAFYDHKASDTYCDFFPRRFRERVVKEIVSDAPVDAGVEDRNG